MELSTVSCNKCGAALQVPDSARFVTCRYCGAQLEIKRTDSTISTEVLDRIDQRTAEMADDLGALRIESEIERLDREWALRRDSLMSRDKYGRTRTPSTAVAILMMFICGGFGVFWTVMAASHGGGAIFPMFGIAFVIAAIAGGVKTITSSQTLSQEEQQYQQRRAQLLVRSNEHERTNV